MYPKMSSKVVVRKDVQAQVGRVGDGEVVAHLGGRHVLAAAVRGPPLAVVVQHLLGLGLKLRRQVRPFVGFLNRVRQRQAGHGVRGVGHQPVVLRRDAQAGEAVGERRAADQHRHRHAIGAEVAHRLHHHLRRLHQQARQPDDVRAVLPVGFYQVLRRHLDAQVDDLVAVVGQDDFDQVLADVVNVALDRCQHHAALEGAFDALHVRLQVVDGELHGLRRLQHLGHDELVGVELAAYLGHAVHQRAVDNLQRRPVLHGLVQIFRQPLLGAFDDGEGQPLVQRQAAALFVGGRRGLVAEVGRESRHRVVAAIPD